MVQTIMFKDTAPSSAGEISEPSKAKACHVAPKVGCQEINFAVERVLNLPFESSDPRFGAARRFFIPRNS